MQNGITRTIAVKGILDELVREIISGGAVAYVRDKVQRFDGDEKIPLKSWSLCNQMIAFFHNTSDARTFNSWQEVGRYPKRGSHPFRLWPRFSRQKRTRLRMLRSRCFPGSAL